MSSKPGWSLGAIGSSWILGQIHGYVVQSHNVPMQICAAKECESKRELNPSKKAPGNVRQEESFLFQAHHRKEIRPNHCCFYVSCPGMNSRLDQTSAVSKASRYQSLMDSKSLQTSKNPNKPWQTTKQHFFVNSFGWELQQRSSLTPHMLWLLMACPLTWDTALKCLLGGAEVNVHLGHW